MCSTSIAGGIQRWKTRPPIAPSASARLRNVQVHKFLCQGTLEERIDEMIESKKEIAAHVVGAGEGWLTELSTSKLKELFALRAEAVQE